jgi:uncharacterized protein
VPVSVDLPDANVWLALTVAVHPGHDRALRYWREETLDRVAFCRLTALGLLRLSTTAAAMGGVPLRSEQAWRTYVALRDLPEVDLRFETESCESVMAGWVEAGIVTARTWTHAYLAAFAISSGLRLVTFDADFSRYVELDLLRLEP